MQGQDEGPLSWEEEERINAYQVNENGFILTDLSWNNEWSLKVVLVGEWQKACMF